MPVKYKSVAAALTAQLRRMEASGELRLPTEAELCRQFGCSRQTVRSALRVLEEKGLIVKKQGSGSYLASGSIHIASRVAVILTDRDAYLAPELLRKMGAILRENGLALDAYSTLGDYLREREILQKLLTSPPAAILIEARRDALPCPNSDLLRQLRQMDVPVAFLFSRYDEPKDAPLIGEDNFGGAQQLVALLHRQGHRRIAGIFRWDSTRGIRRYQGYLHGCGENRILFQEDDILWISEQEEMRILEGDTSLLSRFLATALRECTAVICQNDEIAHRVMQILRRAERRPAVVSFDNSFYAAAEGITSLGHLPGAVGEAAASILLSLMAKKAPRSVSLPWQLAERDSSIQRATP